MTYKDLIQDYSARVDRIRIEIHNTANLKDCPFSAGHDMMVAVSMLNTAARQLDKVAKYAGTDKQIDLSKGTYREVKG